MTVIVVLLTAVAITVSYGQTTLKLKVGVVAGKTVGLPQSPMFPNYTNNDRLQAQSLANFLNSRKPVAPTAPQIDALTLSTLDWNGWVKEARDKGCDYLVVLDVYNASARVQQQRAVGTWDQRMAAIEPDDLPEGASYTVINLRDGKPLPNMPSFVGAPANQAAQAAAKSIYDAIRKAPHP